MKKFRKILIANRGEIAIRVMRAANEMGKSTVAIFAEEDKLSIHRFKADEDDKIGKGLGPVAADLNIEEIISESFERCGIDNQTRTGYFAKSARRSLNLLFSEWSNRGINHWAVSNNTLSLSSGTSNYALPTGTIDIIDAVIREDSTDQMINRISISEYNQIPNKTDTGKPSQYMIDKQYTPQIYF